MASIDALAFVAIGLQLGHLVVVATLQVSRQLRTVTRSSLEALGVLTSPFVLCICLNESILPRALLINTSLAVGWQMPTMVYALSIPINKKATSTSQFGLRALLTVPIAVAVLLLTATHIPLNTPQHLGVAILVAFLIGGFLGLSGVVAVHLARTLKSVIAAMIGSSLASFILTAFLPSGREDIMVGIAVACVMCVSSAVIIVSRSIFVPHVRECCDNRTTI